jgi:hypothetical protein
VNWIMGSLLAVSLSFSIIQPAFAAELFSYPLAPSPDLTPGELCSESDPDFDHHRYQENIPYCVRKLSASRKRDIYELHGIPEECRSYYTVDHFIPLALGGNNADANLWPEHINVKQARHRLEIDLFWALRRGEITQAEAIEVIVTEKHGFKVTPVKGMNPKDDCGLRVLPEI